EFGDAGDGVGAEREGTWFHRFHGFRGFPGFGSRFWFWFWFWFRRRRCFARRRGFWFRRRRCFARRRGFWFWRGAGRQAAGRHEGVAHARLEAVAGDAHVESAGVGALARVGGCVAHDVVRAGVVFDERECAREVVLVAECAAAAVGGHDIRNVVECLEELLADVGACDGVHVAARRS